MIGKLFSLTFIAAVFVAGPLYAQPDSTNSSSKRPPTERKQSSPTATAVAASRVLTVREINIFSYKPAPTRMIDARTLRDEGLARLYIDQQGRVTSVKLMRSSGQREYDTEALDTFRRWRALPGPVRQIDLPLTAITTGKKAPVRLPTATGSMTIG
jgi:TonB family protein